MVLCRNRISNLSSPHARGWFLLVAELRRHSRRFPARVGVFPPSLAQGSGHIAFPARAGVLLSESVFSVRCMPLPRTSGGASKREDAQRLADTFPRTRGVFPTRTPPCTSWAKFPRTCGVTSVVRRVLGETSPLPCARGGVSRNGAPMRLHFHLSPHLRGSPMSRCTLTLRTTKAQHRVALRA